MYIILAGRQIKKYTASNVVVAHHHHYAERITQQDYSKKQEVVLAGTVLLQLQYCWLYFLRSELIGRFFLAIIKQ